MWGEFKDAYAFEQRSEATGPDHASIGHEAGYCWSKGAFGPRNVQADTLTFTNLAFNLCNGGVPAREALRVSQK